MLRIPQSPKALHVVVDALWNAKPCPNPSVRAEIGLAASDEGLELFVAMPRREDERLPKAPMGTRVEGLWNYDVVEVFLRGPGTRYLEIELGAGGHYLVLGFDGVRQRVADFQDRELIVIHHKNKNQWTSEIVIPWEMVPRAIRSMNAYVIASGEFLALSPVPGTEPDFHQPDAFTSCHIET